jgi:hypothetical protein
VNHLPQYPAGSMTTAKRLRLVVVSALIVVLFFGALPAFGQTSPEYCALDSLRLISPGRDGMRVSLSKGSRFGAVLQWADLDDSVTTCGVPVDILGMGSTVSLDGFYADRVDRQLRFSSSTGGQVSSPDVNSVLFTWNNSNQQFTGRITGEINLSNNGGVMGLDSATGEWVQINGGLPQYMTHTDVVAMDVSPRVEGRSAVFLNGRTGRGLWYKGGVDETWVRIAEDVFPDALVEITAISKITFSPADDATFVVGTSNRGLFVTRDAGESFVQILDEFSDDNNWARRSINEIDWSNADELFVAVNGLGLFVSDDDATTFVHLETFVVPEVFPTSSSSVPPIINDIVNMGDGRVLAAVTSFGLYESQDHGQSWSWRWTDLLSPGATPITGKHLYVDPLDGDVILLGTANAGIFRTGDNGGDWDQLAYFDDDVDATTIDTGFLITGLEWDAANGRFIAALDGVGLLTSLDGLVWDMPIDVQTGILNYNDVILGDGVNYDMYLASYGGGIYTPGTALDLTRTIKKNLTDAAYRNLDLGMSIAFSEGEIELNASFSLVLQDFQGFAVWRGEVGAVSADGTPRMELIGLYDKNNPESCIDGFCGSSSYNITPRCYTDKRAACFDFTDPDTIRFFDDNIYDGFVYNYAVTTFDYGNTANSSPASLSSDQLFSPRFDDDPVSVFPGESNFMEYRVNLVANQLAEGEEIFVVPNPLRNTSAGLNQALSGRELHFRNLPPTSRVQVYTVNGDLVADLGPEIQEGHNISWMTPEDLASGVYIYKVEMPDKDDYFGKLVIIR